MNLIIKDADSGRWLDYAFYPRRDITAYELALCLIAINRHATTGKILTTKCEHWPIIEKHFSHFMGDND